MPRRFRSLENILASRSALRAYGAAHKLLGQDQPGADARCAAAAANLAVLRMRPQQQQLPVQQLQQSYSQALTNLPLPQQQQPLPSPPQQPCSAVMPAEGSSLQQQQQGLGHPEAHTLAGFAQPHSLSLLHPARKLHMQQCQPYLAVLQDCLRQLGVEQQQANWTSPTGLWGDLLVDVHAFRAASSSGSNGGQGGSIGSPEAGSSLTSSATLLAFQVLGPADLSSGKVLCMWMPTWHMAV